MVPKVSVVMTVYNSEKYLIEAIESILLQSFKDFEFIIIDDGSTDKSGDIIRSFGDERVRLFQQKNHGVSFSRNMAIRNSIGTLIACMDDDDISLPQRLEKQISFLEENTKIGIIGSGAIMMTEKSEDICMVKMPLDDLEAKELLNKSSPFFYSSVMFRKALLDSYCPFPQDISHLEEIYQIEDWILWYTFSRRTKFANIEEALIKYRVKPNGAFNRTEREVRELKLILYKYLRDRKIDPENISVLKSLNEKRSRKRREADYCFKCGNLFFQKKKDHLKARGMLKKSLLLYPFNIKSVFYFLFTFLSPEMFVSLKTQWKRSKSFIQR